MLLKVVQIIEPNSINFFCDINKFGHCRRSSCPRDMSSKMAGQNNAKGSWPVDETYREPLWSHFMDSLDELYRVMYFSSFEPLVDELCGYFGLFQRFHQQL